MLKDRLIAAYVWIFARPAFFRLNRAVFMLSVRSMGILNYRSDRESGELDFVRSIISEIDVSNAVVLDIGANEGSFAEFLLNISRNLSVLCVEPHPTTFARLQGRLAGRADRFSSLHMGAGSVSSTMKLYDYDDGRGSTHASFASGVIESIHMGSAKAWDVPVRRLDDVLDQQHGRISLVKIDVEGFELEVLKGLTATMTDPNLKYILLEFNEMNVISRVFMRDFRHLLTDFACYRILPKGRLLPLLSYSPIQQELFAYQNIVFIRH